MAAADGLALYLKTLVQGILPADSDRRVLCEWHEDWVVQEGAEAELVSGKHREQSVAVFTTMNMLAGDGGLAHLFDRWSVMQEKPMCRLVTTAGLNRGDPQSLEAATRHYQNMRRSGASVVVDGERRKLVGELRDSIAKHCQPVRERWDGESAGAPIPGDERSTQVARFLSMLRIKHSQPHRDYIHYAAQGLYVEPVLAQMDISETVTAAVVVAVWEAVMQLFRARMRAKGPVPWAGLPDLPFGREDALAAGDHERFLRDRIVTMEDIDVAVEKAISQPAGFKPLVRLPRTTRLAVKMATGGCTDNGIERAEDLRQEYREYWRNRQSGDPTARSEQSRLQRRLLRISDEASRPGLPGYDLWRSLQDRVDDMSADELPTGMDPDLALGGICELSNECKIWFGERFDVAARIADLRAQQETRS
ncbi:hypothetical protein ACWEK5_40495 [Rhodococcus koreensis]